MGLFGRRSKWQKDEIDYDKLADAIVKAHNCIKEQERIEQCNERERLEAKWHEAIRYKEYSETRNVFFRIIREIRNTIVVLFSIIFFRKKYAKDDIVTFGLMKMAISSLFGIIKWLLYIVALIFLLGAFYSLDKNEWIVQPIYILHSFVVLVFARLFRVAAYETENMNDRQNLIGVLSALSAFLALIIAIISLVAAVIK